MEKLTLRKKVFSISVVVSLTATCFGGLFFAYQGDFTTIKNELKNRQGVITHYLKLLSEKDETNKEWKENQMHFRSGSSKTELNAWVKELIQEAQKQGVVFEKLEPRGIKQIEFGDEVGIFVSFEGDSAKFIRFLYALYEKDPLAQVESFFISQSKERGRFSYELTLSKVIR